MQLQRQRCVRRNVKGRCRSHSINYDFKDIQADAYGIITYDNDAQLSSSLGYTSGGTPVTSQQLGFGYDAGWNMTSRSVNGSPATYTVNDRNQLTMMTGPDYFTNDVNGNLTYWGSQSGWQRNLSYDDENRLVGVTVPGYYIGSYQYDGLSRLRVRSEQRWNGSSWVSSTIRYLYDGMCIVQERDGSNVPMVTYTRGKDLSGTLEGAGGIGGLLARSHGYAGGNWSTHNFYHADALGNVTYLVSSAQAMAANYRYDPYGRTISYGGTLASANVFRFSSKLAMDVSAMTLYYYGYRFYDAGLQRWVNRDPIEELGGLNIHAFTRNNPVFLVDAVGLRWWSYFPILNALNCFISEPGEKMSDYNSIPLPSCEKCRQDKDLAEDECKRAVAVMQSHYTGDVLEPMIISGVGDLVLGGISIAYPPLWIGTGIGVIGTACEIVAMMNIDSAADQYAMKYCKCPLD